MKRMKSLRSQTDQDDYAFLGNGKEFSARLPWDYSPPTLSVDGVEDFPLIFSSNFNVTIQLKIKEFKRRQATILAGQALYAVSQEGIDLASWMVIEFLYSFLLGTKQEPFLIKEPKEFEISLLLKVVLLSGTWIGLEGKSKLPDDILLLIKNSPWIPNKRTFHSRKSTYDLKKFLVFRIVPIDLQIERQKGNIRYSSYCKGYGESSTRGRRQKTLPSAELDGEEVDFDWFDFSKIRLSQVPRLLDLTLAEFNYMQNLKKI